MEIDIWSAGVILYIYLAGYLHFEQRMKREYVMHTGRSDHFESEPWPSVSNSAIDIVRTFFLQKFLVYNFLLKNIFSSVISKP